MRRMKLVTVGRRGAVEIGTTGSVAETAFRVSHTPQGALNWTGTASRQTKPETYYRKSRLCWRYLLGLHWEGGVGLDTGC